jgi:hypothetical protein
LVRVVWSLRAETGTSDEQTGDERGGEVFHNNLTS